MRDDTWKEDLHFLAEEMQKIHPNLFFALSKRDFEQAVKKIEASIPQLTDEQIIVELIKLVALPSVTGGRDGHSYVPIFQKATGFRALPLKLNAFSDGWFVVNAREPYQELVRKRLVRVGDVRIEDVATSLNPLVSRDNGTSLKARLGTFFLIPEILRAVGIIKSIDAVDLELANKDEHFISVQPISGEAYESWETAIWQQPENFRAELLEPSTLLISYNAVRDKTQSGESMTQFCERLESLLKETETTRVIVDIRQNGGGNNLTYRPLLEFLSRDALNQTGKLFILISRHTFSAAGNFAAELMQKTKALFVGEPMGGGINQYGDSVPVNLPNSDLMVRIASRYWQMSSADDERLTITPDIVVELSSKDFFAGFDSVLTAVLESE